MDAQCPSVRGNAWLIALAMLPILASCDFTGSTVTQRDVIVSGTLLDDDGVPVTETTVHVLASDAETSSGAHGSGGLGRHNAGNAVDCAPPGVDVVAWSCSDGEGRFSLAFTTTGSSFDLVARRGFRVVRVPFTVTGIARPGTPVTIDLGDRHLPDLDPVEDLDAAIRFALPGLHDYSLVTFPDEKVVADLLSAASSTDSAPRYVGVPLRDADGTVRMAFPLTAYHHDLRLPEAAACEAEVTPKQVVGGLTCVAVQGPSLTFQGLPPWSDATLADAIAFPEEYAPDIVDPVTGDLNESSFQPSIVSLIQSGASGERMSVAGYYFGPSLESPSAFQSLRVTLEAMVDRRTTERLMQAAGEDTYVVFSHADYDPPDIHGAPPPFSHPGEETSSSGGHAGSVHHGAHAHRDHGSTSPEGSTSADVSPLAHMGPLDGPRIARLVAQMVADVTIYDRRRDNPVVQAGWWTRADHAANLQDLVFTWMQLYADAPPERTSLEQWSNAFVLRTRIGRYWALTRASAQALDTNDSACGGVPTLMDEYRQRSPTTVQDDDLEFWAWWTNSSRYVTFNADGEFVSGTLGCAYVGRLGETGRDGNVSWTHLSALSLDMTAYVFIHETGHLINGTHRTAATVRRSQRCNLLGFIPIGPTGPSLHHWFVDGEENTLCFARTEDGDAVARNMTRVAEFLHDLLPEAQ